MSRIILHCDCNAYFASVAELVNPELKKVPMAVCGDPESRRGIILAKNELAKGFNVKTAETVWQAKQKCPNLVLAPTYRDLYTKYYHIINHIYEEYTDLVERFGIDESFLDVTNSIHLFNTDGEGLANIIRERVQKETGLTISIGVSNNKFFSKMGSDYKKPNAVTAINENNYRKLLWQMPVGTMFMVGQATEKTLNKFSIFTIGELAQTEPQVLESLFGKSGMQLYEFANGLDKSPVISYRDSEEVKSVGNGRTFKKNLTTQSEIQIGIKTLADTVASRLRESGLKCMSVQISIKDVNLKTITRQTSLDVPTQLGKEIAETSIELINESWESGKPIRMLTVTAGKLIPENEAIWQTSLFEKDNIVKKHHKQESLEKTIDKLTDKFGKNSIKYGGIIDNDLGI